MNKSFFSKLTINDGDILVGSDEIDPKKQLINK